MDKYLFTKKVDVSLLKAGLTIPVDKCDDILNAVGAVLSKGSRVTINIFVEGVAYPAILTHVNLSKSDRDVYQIRYAEGSAICQRLKETFGGIHSGDFIEIYADNNRNLYFRCIKRDILVDFFEYLGKISNSTEDSMQRFVFCKYLFSEVFFNEYVCIDCLKSILLQHFIDKLRSEKLIENEWNSKAVSIPDTLVSELKNSLYAEVTDELCSNGFGEIRVINTKEYFYFSAELMDKLTPSVLDEIRNIIFTKLYNE